MKNEIKGYKVTDSEMNCRGFQYEIGKTFTHSGNISLCNYGFHFCLIANDCFNYYDFKSENRVFEIIARGEIKNEGDKSVTNEIEFVRELTWAEVLAIVNIGKDNTGRANTGNSNTGNWNTGYSNTGYSNTGYCNTGNWNTGNSNTGDSNTGYRNTGAFCTDENPVVWLFDKPTNILVRDWEQSKPYQIMRDYLNPNIFIWESSMTEDEKEKYPTYKTTGGYLKSISMHEAWANMWGNLNAESKAVFTSLENFDADKFFTITGIKI